MTDEIYVKVLLNRLAEAFNAHDTEAILTLFAEDAVMELPRGPLVCGRRFVGKAAIREGVRARFEGMPDVRWENARHVVAGDVGLSTWTIHGIQTDGTVLHMNGCDIYTFRDGLVIRKDSYWKARA